MEIQQLNGIKYQKIEWTIRNYKTLKTNTRYCSEVFTDSHCDWNFAVYRGKEGKKDLAIYLYVADASNLAKGWSIEAEFTVTVVNQSSRKKSKRNEMNHKFCNKEVRCKCLEVLEGEKNGLIRDNKCIVELEFKVVIPARLVDFKGLAGIEEPCGPLLKKVFELYPSLLDYKKNRIPQSRVTAFNVLGRVLIFLKEKKLKDMKDEKSRKELQHMWEELGKSGLDLSWLEPNVKSALDMKGYKTEEEKLKLKQKLEPLEEKMKELKEKLLDIEKSVKKTRKDLEKAEGFKDKNLDARIWIP